MCFRALVQVVCVFLVANIVGTAKAADVEKRPLSSFMEAYPPRIAARLKSYDSTMKAVGLSPEAGAKGVFASPLIWPPDNAQIKVCFFNGSQPVRQLVAAIALEWTRFDAHIPLDFGDNYDPRICDKSEFSHIRILLNDKAKNYSAIGLLSVKALSQDEPSMALGVVDGERQKLVNPLDLRRLVLHEFGHALALGHEHQNPFAKCEDEYNWDFIYDKLAKPPHKWSKEQVDINMRQLSMPGIFATDFDKLSVMLYTFPAEYYLNGEQSSCYSEPHFSVSPTDQELIAELYPKDRSRRFAQYNKRRQNLLTLAKKAKAGAAQKSAAMQMLGDFLPEIKE
jgi:hypothetical protein